VFQKPRMYLLITLLTNEEENGTAYIKTPWDVANLHLMTDCLLETVNQEMGYEAYLADIEYNIKNFEDRGIKLQFSGYQATLITFAKLFVDLMLLHR